MLAAGLVVWCASTLAAAPVAHEFTLANGLQVIVQEDHRADVAVVQLWYKVGAADEQDGATGVSHALEHMMFKRTKNLATGEFSRLVAAQGGRENAFTTADYTTYFQQWSAANVELSFKLEADRMQNLLLDPDEFKNERKVIHEERRLRTDDSAQAAALETVLANTWQTSPYRQPVIGWAADIDQMQLSELAAWYHRFYTPNNAILVVVGNVQLAAILKLAEQYFGPLEKRELPLRKARPEVAQRGAKRLQITSDKIQLPILLMNYKTPGLVQIKQTEPPIEEWEVYALDVLAATLDGGASARFARELVRGGLALGASASYQSTSRLWDLFTFGGTPRREHSLPELEQAIKAQINGIQSKPPTAAELERIKTGVIAEAIYQQDSMSGQAMLIGSLAVVGLDWRLKDQYADKIQAVTPAQVQAVARKYLVDEHSTIAYVMPEQPK